MTLAIKSVSFQTLTLPETNTWPVKMGWISSCPQKGLGFIRSRISGTMSTMEVGSWWSLAPALMDVYRADLRMHSRWMMKLNVYPPVSAVLFSFHVVSVKGGHWTSAKGCPCNIWEVLFLQRMFKKDHLGCGFNLFYFHPDPWGFMIPFDVRIFFRWVARNHRLVSHHFHQLLLMCFVNILLEQNRQRLGYFFSWFHMPLQDPGVPLTKQDLMLHRVLVSRSIGHGYLGGTSRWVMEITRVVCHNQTETDGIIPVV